MYKNFNKLIVALILSIIIMIGALNFIIDPFAKNNMFKNSFNAEKATRDERIRKFQLLAKYPKAKSFIFGSSRSLRLDPIVFERYTHTSTLNLGFTNGFVDEYYLYIKYLIETRKVENILIGIDLFSYAQNYVSDGVLPEELQNYFNINSNAYSITKYLSFDVLKSTIKTIKYNIKHEGKVIERYTEKGRRSHDPYKKIANDFNAIQTYAQQYVVNDSVHWNTRSNYLDQSKLDKLQEIVHLCKVHDIKLYLFMSPLYIKQIQMKENKFALQKELLKYIAKNISPIWDYNAITKINLDPTAYDDPFHYTFKTADSIITEILTGIPTIEEYKGTYITVKNVDSYLNNIP